MKRFFSSASALIALLGLAVLFAQCGGNEHSATVAQPTAVAAQPPEPAKVVDTPSGRFLCISDIHLNKQAVSVEYGCDTGTDLWSAAKTKLAELIKEQQPDFVLYLGDLPGHEYQGASCVQSGSMDDIHEDIGMVLEGLRTVATQAGVPLLYLPGNNDAFGGDYHSFTYIENGQKITPFSEDKGGTSQWPIISGNKQPSFFNMQGNRELGYYSAYPLGTGNANNLRVLMLNTVIFVSASGSHPYVSNDNISQEVAAKQQLAWMANQLEDAAKKNETVMVCMHIPPGFDGYGGNAYWLENTKVINGNTVLEEFLSLVDTYQSTINGILYSHTHMEEIKRLYNSKKEFIELCISTPGITVQHYNNPGMKVFTYDPATYELQDFTTWYAEGNGSFAFAKGQQYTFGNTFGCSGSSMMECIANISSTPDAAGEQLILAKMNEIYTVKNPNGGDYKNPFALDVLPQ